MKTASELIAAHADTNGLSRLKTTWERAKDTTPEACAYIEELERVLAAERALIDSMALQFKKTLEGLQEQVHGMEVVNNQLTTLVNSLQADKTKAPPAPITPPAPTIPPVK